MRCSQCGTELLPGKRFCHACGASALASCASCGEPLDPAFLFCPECGTPVAGPERPAVPAEDPLRRHIPEHLAAKIRQAGAVAGERKRATVLFCDLVGSTAIAEGLDPEEYRELLDQFLEIAFAQIYRYEGIVNQLAGDGFMALFGAPIAHEDAPERSVRAALGIQEALGRLDERLPSKPGIELSARIGVHTGTVVVGTMGNDLKTDYTAIGDTTNLAARLQAVAAPGSILISDATHALVRDRFRTQPVGPFDVKGKAEPITAHEVLELADATPMAIAEARGLTPLVGREPELAQLEACYRRLSDNLAQVVSIVGEAGSGKSRLVHEFKQRLAGENVLVLAGRCSSLTRGVPYAPWEMMMRRFFGLDAEGGAENPCDQIREKISSVVGAEQAGLVAPYLCAMLAIPTPDALPRVETSKQQFFDAMSKLVGHASKQRPVVMIVEDLHWIDDASLEMLELAIRVSHDDSLMLLVTHRPEFKPTWQSQAASTQLHLRLLDDDEARRIVRARAGGALPPALEERILRRAEGNPFYLEELTRALLEEGTLVAEGDQVRVTRPVESIRIPDTVRELLGARLDRLRPESKRVAQVASVFGRQFRAEQLEELLSRAGAGGGIVLAQELAELQQRGVIHREGLSSDEFRFGESLTQEVAYEGLLLRERRQLHEQVGHLLEESSSGSEAGGEAGALALIGYHYARSDEREKGILKLLEAADQAEAMPSYGDAMRLYRRAWDLAEVALTETRNGSGSLRAATLRAVRGFLGVVVIYSPDGPNEDMERAVARGIELARELADMESLAVLQSTRGSMVLYGGREHFAEGIGLMEDAVDIARGAGLDHTVARLSRSLAWAYLGDGRFEQARSCIADAMAELERLGEHERMTDTYLGGRFFQNRILIETDDFEVALPSCLETRELARAHGNRTIESASESQLGALYFRKGDYVEAERWAQSGLELADEIGSSVAQSSCSTVLLGVRYERDPSTVKLSELADLERGIDPGTDLGSVAIEVLLDMGDIERAQRVAEAGAATAGGRLRESRNEISLGGVALHRGAEHFAAAEHHLERGLLLARETGSRFLVAKALLGLAELARARGEGAGSAAEKEALETFRALGLGHYASRAERLRAAS